VTAQVGSEEEQRLAMMTWMEEREQKWDARYEDNKVWGAGITNMIAKTMKGVAQGQEWREREREVTARTNGGGLEASQHTDTTREEGQEERQQLQLLPKPRPKLQLKLQTKQQARAQPKSAPISARRWATVPPRTKSQRASISPGPGPGPAPTAR
jgi:hypothetical protein